LSLRNAFKNFRKNYTKNIDPANDDNTTNDPPAKRCKLYHDDDDGYIDEEYAEALSELKAYGPPKKGNNHKDVKRLMELTEDNSGSETKNLLYLKLLIGFPI